MPSSWGAVVPPILYLGDLYDGVVRFWWCGALSPGVCEIDVGDGPVQYRVIAIRLVASLGNRPLGEAGRLNSRFSLCSLSLSVSATMANQITGT